MLSTVVIYLTLSTIGLSYSAVLPVEKCKLEDSSCMVPAFQKAVPIFMAGLLEVGVDVLDVMQMDNIEFDLAGFQFSMKNGTLKGMKSTIVDSVKWSESKKKINLDFHLNSTMKGQYTAAGRLLILPISGEGQITVKLKNVAVKIVIDYEVEQDGEGKNHVAPKKYDFDFVVKDNAHFTMTNLFNGNKELSDTMHTFMNQNWRQISAEFGKPIMKSATQTIYKNILKFFKKIPIDDIALP